jgi:kynurenine formamidase
MPPASRFGSRQRALKLRVYQQSPDGRDALDTVRITPHGFDVTHVDALCHSFFNGMAYNGRKARDIVHESGLRFGGVQAMATGIVTRGVLLDVAAGVPDGQLEQLDSIGEEQLDQVECQGGTGVLPGDAVFVRAGLAARELPPGQRPGLIASAVRWLHRRQVAVYGGDCIERMPGDEQVRMVLHQIGHAAMGLAILDNPDVERLRAACEQHGRNSFLLLVAPLAIQGATGCAVNPLAIF